MDNRTSRLQTFSRAKGHESSARAVFPARWCPFLQEIHRQLHNAAGIHVPERQAQYTGLWVRFFKHALEKLQSIRILFSF